MFANHLLAHASPSTVALFKTATYAHLHAPSHPAFGTAVGVAAPKVITHAASGAGLAAGERRMREQLLAWAAEIGSHPARRSCAAHG